MSGLACLAALLTVLLVAVGALTIALVNTRCEAGRRLGKLERMTDSLDQRHWAAFQREDRWATKYQVDAFLARLAGLEALTTEPCGSCKGNGQCTDCGGSGKRGRCGVGGTP